MAEVVLDGVAKRYGALTALQPTALTVPDGEFLTLLGPSGCGKTTTLRLIAGFIEASEGRIFIGREDVTQRPPQHRQIGMVFQDYALFPHLTIAENIGFGLVERGMKRADIRARVDELLSLIQLPGIANRYPAEISGGQQQRVAVARAVAFPPRVLLMDEPLGALDLKLRESMQTELRRIQQELRITTVYVTHDQTEAMTMSDQIAVMHNGLIEQLASPTEIYTRPRTRFVADFVGKVNVERGVLRECDAGMATIAVGETSLRALVCTGLPSRSEVTLAIRPERLRLDPVGSGNALPGNVTAKVFVGSRWNVQVVLRSGAEWTIELLDAAALDVGQPVLLCWAPEDCFILDD
jgi:spermidine/putrescine ABC transporter ATP-binding subunit